MRARTLIVLFFVTGGIFFFSAALQARAETVTFYSQTDDSGEMLSQQPDAVTAWISASLGNLVLGKDSLTITFAMKDPHANNPYHSPFGGVAIGTCLGCTDLQKYNFTDADRTLLSDGTFHTFTVQTGTTALGVADGETPIYITFFNLAQYHLGTHLKSNTGGTIPYLRIEGPPLPPLENPQVPANYVTAYEQSDNTGRMTNSQPTNLRSYIDSANLGNLNLGQGPLYLTFTIKSPNVNAGMPREVCIEPTSLPDCSYGTNPKLQEYFFTAADHALLSDQGFHTFTVLTGSTTSPYADGTHPVSVGFSGLYQIQYGTKVKSNAAATIPYLKIQMLPPPDPCIAAGTCVSNVLFLPGIETSHLYRPVDGCDVTVSDCTEHKLWDPSGDADLNDLGLDAAGKSIRSDIYAREGDIVSSASAFGQTNVFYDAFVVQMNALKKGGSINDWEPVAYDWRLSLPNLISNGTERYGKIFYEEATSTPYIEQTLRALAASSKTGKVTIVAHSNGGLVAKALLNQPDGEAAKLVDKVIMVGVPQSGAPQAVGGLLFGYGQALPLDNCSQLFLIGNICSSLASRAAARALAENSPMAYHLVPSDAYFASVQDAAHAVVSFTGTHEYQQEQAAYGPVIDTFSKLSDFLQAKDGARTKPLLSDIGSADILGGTLLDYAKAEHRDVLDTWVPPSGVTLYQVAGWGVDTVSGINFYEDKKFFGLVPGYTPEYRPTFTEDGDGVVPVPSALLTSTSTPNVKRYWVDIAKINNIPGAHTKYGHGDILEIQSVRDFINNILNNNTDSLPTYIVSSQPPPNTASKKLTFFLHSPLTLQLTDASGNITGLAPDGSVSQDIPGSTYGEFGEVKYVIAPEGAYQLTMHGLSSGTFSLDIQETDNGVTTSSTIANVPVTPSTLASLTIADGLETASSLTVENGGGTDTIVIAPKVGETVTYEPPVQAAVVATPPAPALAGSISIPIIAPVVAPPLVIAASTTVVQSVATSTLALASPAKPLKTKKLAVAPAKVVKTDAKASVAQTASVYDASQQPALKRLGAAVYNRWQGFWAALKSLFSK